MQSIRDFRTFKLWYVTLTKNGNTFKIVLLSCMSYKIKALKKFFVYHVILEI